jgi:hypothetical protein
MSFGAFCLLDFTCSLVATDGTIRKSRKKTTNPCNLKVENGHAGIFWCRLCELAPLYQYVCNHFSTNDYVCKGTYTFCKFQIILHFLRK